MQLEASKLYEIALEQCMILQQQVIELKALYLDAKEKLDTLKDKEGIELSE